MIIVMLGLRTMHFMLWMEMMLLKYLDIPEDDNTAYIAAYEVIDDDETKEPRFTVIWTSRRMLARTSNNMTQDDATYRLTWQGK